MDKRLRRIYCSMKQRCYNPKNISYKHYGKFGITICEEWLYSDKAHSGWNNFKRWALANGYNDNLTIDRIDNRKGYSPSNCRWVSMKVQENNRTNNHFITYKEKTQSMKDWCEELGLRYDVIKNRISKYHWAPEKAFETKERPRYRMLTYKGKTQSMRDWCKELGLKYDTVEARLNQFHWSVEKAFEYKNPRQS